MRSLRDEIDHMRKKLGPVPRQVSSSLARHHRLEKPDWIEDDLTIAYRDASLLLEHGLVVWGHIVQANAGLFEDGDEPLPAAIIYSTDTWFDDRMARLEDLAGSLFDLKNTNPGNPEVERFAAAITDETTTLLNQRLPLSGRDATVSYTSIVIHPGSLPLPRLTFSFFPILVAPALTQGCMLLHRGSWSRNLRAFWRTA